MMGEAYWIVKNSIEEDAKRIVEARRRAREYGTTHRREDGIVEIDDVVHEQLSLEEDLLDARSAEEETALLKRVRELSLN